MKNRLKSLLLVAFANSMSFCNKSSNQKSSCTNINRFNKLEKASWLFGEWQNKSPEGNATEIWERENDSMFAGKSYFVVGKDTVSSETISLRQNGNELFYIPTVKGQNNEQPVKFALTSSTRKQLIFENSTHDFPQKIAYTQITNDSLMTEISGTMNGKQNSQKFVLTRKAIHSRSK